MRMKKMMKLLLRLMLLQNPMLRKKTMQKKTRKKLLQKLPHCASLQPVLPPPSFRQQQSAGPGRRCAEQKAFLQFSTGAGT